MIGMWENPFNMNQDLSFGDIEVGVGIQYAVCHSCHYHVQSLLNSVTD